MKFFTYQDGKVYLLKDELMAIKPFKDLIERDRGNRTARQGAKTIIIDGDSSGRNKQRSFMELGLIWWINNVNSPGIQDGLEDEALLHDGIHNLGLPVDWEPDKYWNAANEYYKRNKDTEAVKALKNTYVGFNLINTFVEKNLKVLRKEVEKESVDDIKFSAAQKAIDYLMNLSTDLPTKVQKLKDVIELVDKEEEEGGIYAKGKVPVPDSARPEKRH
jgi:hypothetical protein